jgi:hypothetical protein
VIPATPVGETERRQGWLAGFLTGLMSESAHGLGERAECATRCVGAGLAKASHAQDDQG